MGGNHRISFGANYRIYRKHVSYYSVYLYGVMLLLSVIISLHFWFRDLIREFYKKYEVLLMSYFLLVLYFLLLRVYYLHHSSGELSIHYLHQIMVCVQEKDYMLLILVN